MPLGAWSHCGGSPHVYTYTESSSAGEGRMGLVLCPGHIWTLELLPSRTAWREGPSLAWFGPALIQLESVTQLCYCLSCLVFGLSLGQLEP